MPGDTIIPPTSRERLVRGNRKVVTSDNFRHFFPDEWMAEAAVEQALAGLPEETIWTFGAVTMRQEWTPRREPGSLHGRKVRSWDRLSERQQRRVSTNWAVKRAAAKVHMSPRQWYEHGGDIRPVENRGYRRGYAYYIERESDKVTGYKRSPARRAEMGARIRMAYATGQHKRRA